MNDKFDEFISILKALDQHNVEYILIGGVAVILYGFERLTQDLDIFIKKSSKNIERLREALNSIYDDKSIILMNEELNWS